MDNVKVILSHINSLNLSLEQYIEIYKIIKLDKNVKIMKNNNGVFINLYDLSENTIHNLQNLIHYISTNDLSKNI